MQNIVRATFEAATYGLLIGTLYALVAVGVVLIFRSTRTVNFSHGHFAVIGGFIYLQVSILSGMPVVLGLLAGAAMVAACGAVWAGIAQNMQRRGNDLVPLVASLGVFIALDGLIVRLWGGHQPYAVPALLPRFDIAVGQLRVDSSLLWIAVAAIVLCVALTLFFRSTDLGLKMRAAVQNREAAELIGISTSRLTFYAWIVGSLLGFIGLMLYAPRSYLENSTMTGVLIRAFAASSVGGFESFTGAIIGALILGVAEALAGRFVDPSVQSMVALLLIMGMIFASPKGVFVVRGERG